jgi:flagellar biosynthesis/type III secretory pathway protein FliH
LPAPGQEERLAMREQARAEGFGQGQGEGRAAALAQWESRLGTLADALAGAARGLAARRVELAAELERELPRLVLLLARKVLHQELAVAGTAAQTAIRGVAERLAGLGRPVVVRLAPSEAEAFEAWRRVQADPALDGRHVRLEPDAGLGPGDWMLDDGEGLVDGRVESQIEEAWRLLSETLR